MRLTIRPRCTAGRLAIAFPLHFHSEAVDGVFDLDRCIAGDPVKLADAMVRLSREAKPPLRFAAGAFAAKTIGDKLSDMSSELERWRQVSIDTDFSA